MNDLSPRQQQMLDLIARGYSDEEIARKLGLAVGTVKVHVSALLAKLGVHWLARSRPLSGRPELPLRSASGPALARG